MFVQLGRSESALKQDWMYVCKDKRIKQTRLNAVQANGNVHELWGDLAPGSATVAVGIKLKSSFVQFSWYV